MDQEFVAILDRLQDCDQRHQDSRPHRDALWRYVLGARATERAATLRQCAKILEGVATAYQQGRRITVAEVVRRWAGVKH